MPATPDLKSLFLLDPEITFLNFGSYGACPRMIFDDYMKWQRELEREPVQFMSVNGPAYVKNAGKALGAFINCDADDLVFTPNPTFAMNIVAKNMDLKEGDEILSTALEYGAMDRTWNYYCGRKGAKFIRQKISLPILSKEKFIEDFWKGYSPRTRAVFISHITSATGLILPVNEICERAKELGLMTIVDGAHAPGQLPLDLGKLNADAYTGACHKWMMTPKGSSFLYVKKEYQERLDPLVVSWGYESDHPSPSRFIDYHQFNGTRDFSAYLTIPAALKFREDYNWDAVAATCRELVRSQAPRFFDLLGSEPLAPVTDSFIAQLLSVPVRTPAPEQLQRILFERYKIEIPVMKQDGHIYIRYSINGFNSPEDLDRLYDALTEIKRAGRLL